MPARPPIVVLDACVLANQTVADLLLRLAEDPPLIWPRWSEEILAEVRRTHRKLDWPDSLAESWQTDVSACFPEAAFDAPPGLLPRLWNQAKDRHVLGTAIASKAETIVTFNLRDFPPAYPFALGYPSKAPGCFCRRNPAETSDGDAPESPGHGPPSWACEDPGETETRPTGHGQHSGPVPPNVMSTPLKSPPGGRSGRACSADEAWRRRRRR
jgi:predicted nucleic acid-binding protein